MAGLRDQGRRERGRTDAHLRHQPPGPSDRDCVRRPLRRRKREQKHVREFHRPRQEGSPRPSGAHEVSAALQICLTLNVPQLLH